MVDLDAMLDEMMDSYDDTYNENSNDDFIEEDVITEDVDDIYTATLDLMLEDAMYEYSKIDDYIVGEAGDSVMMEAGSIGDFIESLIKKVKDLVKSVTDKIKGFLSTKKVSNEIDEMEKLVKENNNIRNEKIQITDYDKLNKLSKETKSKLKKAKSKDQVDSIMSGYRSKRKGILAAVAVTAITIGGALAFLKTNHNKKIDDLNKSVDQMEKDLNTMAKDEVPVFKLKESNVADPVELVHYTAAAMSEVTKDEVKDAHNSVKDTMVAVKRSVNYIDRMTGVQNTASKAARERGFNRTKAKDNKLMEKTSKANKENTKKAIENVVKLSEERYEKRKEANDPAVKNVSKKEYVKQDIAPIVDEMKKRNSERNRIKTPYDLNPKSVNNELTKRMNELQKIISKRDSTPTEKSRARRELDKLSKERQDQIKEFHEILNNAV